MLVNPLNAILLFEDVYGKKQRLRRQFLPFKSVYKPLPQFVGQNILNKNNVLAWGRGLAQALLSNGWH